MPPSGSPYWREHYHCTGGTDQLEKFSPYSRVHVVTNHVQDSTWSACTSDAWITAFWCYLHRNRGGRRAYLPPAGLQRRRDHQLTQAAVLQLTCAYFVFWKIAFAEECGDVAIPT